MYTTADSWPVQAVCQSLCHVQHSRQLACPSRLLVTLSCTPQQTAGLSKPWFSHSVMYNTADSWPVQALCQSLCHVHHSRQLACPSPVSVTLSCTPQQTAGLSKPCVSHSVMYNTVDSWPVQALCQSLCHVQHTDSWPVDALSQSPCHVQQRTGAERWVSRLTVSITTLF